MFAKVNTRFKKCMECGLEKHMWICFQKHPTIRGKRDPVCKSCVTRKERVERVKARTEKEQWIAIKRRKVKRPKCDDKVANKVWDFENERVVEVKK
jgi:hypothetical protein